jgi:hypothetical protein
MNALPSPQDAPTVYGSAALKESPTGKRVVEVQGEY